MPRIRRNIVTNRMLEAERNNRTYQCIITDLVLAGALDRSVAEGLLGYKIPVDLLKLPYYFKDFCDTDDFEEDAPETTEEATEEVEDSEVTEETEADGDE